MTIICALGASLWLSSPQRRWLAILARSLAVLLPALVAIGLFGCDYHWVGDMCGGTFLGIATANVVWRLYAKVQERGGARGPHALSDAG
jgi:membrane-associated phospholipid phosphatase